MNDIKRGEMFYISRGGASYNGSEQHADRPAVVVSNNKNNENSNVVEVVYMTREKEAFIGGIEFARDWNLDIPPDDLRLYERLIQERTKKENEQSHIDG